MFLRGEAWLQNSIRAFEYAWTGTVKAAANLGQTVASKAARLLWMTGLDKFPDEFEGVEYVAAIERWQQRSDAWKLAEIQQLEIAEADSEALRRSTARMALEAGFFSVSMTVFADNADMRRRFIEIFPGTARDCFDSLTTETLSRNGGHC